MYMCFLQVGCSSVYESFGQSSYDDCDLNMSVKSSSNLFSAGLVLSFAVINNGIK